tara:strand:- start:272 stop:520 length:249 start_codon:yes stop_codon:yes gene_type:complete
MINLKYSKDVKKDYEQLSDGRKKYINNRANKKGISVSEYLTKKVEERRKAEREAEKREQERIVNKQERIAKKREEKYGENTK